MHEFAKQQKKDQVTPSRAAGALIAMIFVSLIVVLAAQQVADQLLK